MESEPNFAIKLAICLSSIMHFHDNALFANGLHGCVSAPLNGHTETLYFGRL